MPLQKLQPLMSHTVFRWASGVSALVSLVLPVLAIAMYQPGLEGLRRAHAWVGAAFLVVSLLAALSGYRYGKEANRPGLFPHGIGVFGLGVVQYVLALTWVHIVLGALLTIGAIALFVMALRQPYVVTASGRGSGAPDPPA